jgi:hypothetical protein
MTDQCYELPLLELLQRVPRNARYCEETPTSATFYPVGRYCHEAAAEIERLRAVIADASMKVDTALSLLEEQPVGCGCTYRDSPTGREYLRCKSHEYLNAYRRVDG